MPLDMREILKALSPEDKALWCQHRTEMRKSYLHAHNMTLGIERWEHIDDAFMDLVDIRLAQLFDRSGKLQATKELIGKEDKKIEEEIVNQKEEAKAEQTAVIDKVTGWA